MLKILRTTTNASRLAPLLLLALAIIPPSTAATPTLLPIYSFNNLSDGAYPEAGVVMSTSGALYGTTSSGGAAGWGTVFQLTPASGGAYTQTTLYGFTGGADGANPVADLVIGKNNVLYGTTYGGGAAGYGTVFQLAQVSGQWVEKVLYSFQNGTDGAYPAAGLVLASTGALYGATYGGGSTGLGTVFQVTPSAGTWTEKVLYTFQGGTDGAYPLADLALATSGVLYGTTSQGGSVTISGSVYANWGTIFQVAPSGGGVWKESVLYTFTGGSDGGTPESALIIGPNTVLYGSTFWGGTPTSCPAAGYPQGCGTIFQLAPTKGAPWTQTVLHTFTGKSPDGAHPYRNLARNTSGVLFGSTYAGGAPVDICFPAGSFPGCGTVFNLKPPATAGNPWTKGNLGVFTGYNGGAPNGVIYSSGSLFGTTIVGGTAPSYGEVFQWLP